MTGIIGLIASGITGVILASIIFQMLQHGNASTGILGAFFTGIGNIVKTLFVGKAGTAA